MVSVEGEFFERALIGREACLHENMLSKHYLGVRALITHEFEKGFELKNSTSLLYLPFHSRLRLGKSLETCCVNFFSLELVF